MSERYPAGPAARGDMRARVIGQAVREARRRAGLHGRTLDCANGRHATAVHGCKNDGTSCLCWCHDFPPPEATPGGHLVSEQRCTVNEAYLGVMLGDCGKPTEIVVTYECPAHHVTVTPMCVNHAWQLLPDDETGHEPPPVFCTDCYSDGDEFACEITGQREPLPDAIPGQEALFGQVSADG